MKVDAKEEKIDWLQSLAIGAFLGIGGPILVKITTQFVTPNIAWPIVYLVLLLIWYPLFARGKPNRWTKDKRPITFVSYMVPVLIFIAVLFCFTTFIIPEDLLF